jgi:hypothetical protein
MTPTIGYDSDHAPELRQIRRLTLEPCPDCCGRRMPGPGAHSPRWTVRDGRHVQVDCVGKEVTR